MTEARPWLPQNGLVGGRSVSAVGAIVDAWAAHWFDAPPLVLAGRWVLQLDTAKVDSGEWGMPLAIADGLTLQCRIDAEEAIARALLALPGQQQSRHGEDHRLLKTAATAVIVDLRERLSQLAPTRVARAGGADFALAFTDLAGRPVLQLLANETLLVLLTQEGVTATRDFPALAKRDDAVGPRTVEAAALIGRARFAYADLLDLAVGDVLILDSPHGTPFDLMVEGSVAAHRAIPTETRTQDPSSP